MLDPGLGTFLWTSIAFLIVLALLGKFAWKPILSSIHERERNIQESLDSAENAKKEMEEMKAKNETLLQEAREERDKMLKEARETRDKIVSDAKEDARKEADQLLKNAREEIEQEKKAAVEELKSEVARFSIDIAEKLVREKLSDDKEQKELAERLMKEVEMNS